MPSLLTPRPTRRRLSRAVLLTILVATAVGSASAAEHIFSSGFSTTGGKTVYFDLDGGTSSLTAFAAADYRLVRNTGPAPSLTIPSLSAGTFLTVPPDPAIGSRVATADVLKNSNGRPARLNPGATINASAGTFGLASILYNGTGSLVTSGDFAVPDHGYIGLRLTDSNNNFFYGWAELTILPDANVRLDRFGYQDTPNAPITIPGGVAPEPGTLALLALALPVAELVRRRKA